MQKQYDTHSPGRSNKRFESSSEKRTAPPYNPVTQHCYGGRLISKNTMCANPNWRYK